MLVVKTNTRLVPLGDVLVIIVALLVDCISNRMKMRNNMDNLEEIIDKRIRYNEEWINSVFNADYYKGAKSELEKLKKIIRCESILEEK